MQKTKSMLEFGSKDDFQLAQALNHLKGLPVQLSKVKIESKKEPSINDEKKNGDKNGNGNGNGNGNKK